MTFRNRKKTWFVRLMEKAMAVRNILANFFRTRPKAKDFFVHVHYIFPSPHICMYKFFSHQIFVTKAIAEVIMDYALLVLPSSIRLLSVYKCRTLPKMAFSQLRIKCVIEWRKSRFRKMFSSHAIDVIYAFVNMI